MASFVTVVSGLPRSGTSMMMKMLEAGGMSLLADHLRVADTDNPNGYYEFERVKKLPQGDVAWLSEARGRAVKIIAALLPHLPPAYEYRVLFMQREIREVLASQRKMLEHRGASQEVNDEALGRLFEKHIRQVDTWIKTQPNVLRMGINYNELLRNPAPIVANIRFFLDLELDADKMTAIINPSLYRQRAPVAEVVP